LGFVSPPTLPMHDASCIMLNIDWTPLCIHVSKLVLIFRALFQWILTTGTKSLRPSIPLSLSLHSPPSFPFLSIQGFFHSPPFLSHPLLRSFPLPPLNRARGLGERCNPPAGFGAESRPAANAFWRIFWGQVTFLVAMIFDKLNVKTCWMCIKNF